MKPRPKKHVPLPRPVRPGRRRVVGERVAAEPKGQKGLFERAFYESRLRGPPRNTFVNTAAVIGCFSYCSFCLFCSPDVRISKTARSQVIRDWT